MNLLTYLDEKIGGKGKVYVINLEQRVERMEYCATKLNDTGFPEVERFPAVYWKNVDIKEVAKLNKDCPPSAIGCYLSHIGILKRLLQDDSLDYVVIFEDDIDFCDNFVDIFPDRFEQVPDEWDVLFVGSHYRKKVLCDKYVFGDIHKVKECLVLTHFMIVKKAAAKIIVGNHLPITKQYDYYFDTLKHKLNLYNIVGIAGQNNEFMTDIQNHGLNNFQQYKRALVMKYMLGVMKEMGIEQNRNINTVEQYLKKDKGIEQLISLGTDGEEPQIKNEDKKNELLKIVNDNYKSDIILEDMDIIEGRFYKTLKNNCFLTGEQLKLFACLTYYVKRRRGLDINNILASYALFEQFIKDISKLQTN